MARSKRGVQFQHRDREIRRTNSSTSGSNNSAASSPVRNGSVKNGSGKIAPAIPRSKEPVAEPTDTYAQKKATFITRAIWTLAMIGGFFFAIFAGHIYILMVITAVQIISFKEVIAIAQVPTKQKNLPLTKSLNWYFLSVTMYFLYGESVIYYFKHILLVDRVFLPFATHHRFISFMMYILGFVFFVSSLKKGHYRFQFTQFAWTHMALYLIVVQAHFVMNNIFEGMIWFFLPVSLVITNDIFAYLCGITFGRTQLIKLSPKKTVEGFVGAWICTIFFAHLLTNILTRYKYFICPVNDLGANIFTGLKCTPNPVFTARPHQLPAWTHIEHVFWIAPVQFHVIAYASFASLIAPFGGFFASGLKRTFKIKDFGDSIPGHGGMTDRMDCQFVMGFFSYMYYQSFIAVYKTSVGSVIQTAITGLTYEEQADVVRSLTKYLYNQGAVTEKLLQCITAELLRK